MDLAGCSIVPVVADPEGSLLSRLALLAGLFPDPLDAPLALGYALVAHGDMGRDDRGVLAELGDDELLLDHLDLLVEGLQVSVVQLVHILKEYPN